MLDEDAARNYGDLVGGVARLRLARPALDALASAAGPVRQGDLAVMLVAETGTAVHSRTLTNALRFLAAAGLIIRHKHSTRSVEYEATGFGRELCAALAAADRVARAYEQKTRQEPDDIFKEPDEPG